MTCNQIDELLIDYLYQELDPVEAERFEAHLQHCARCSGEVSSFETTRGMLCELSEEEPPTHLSSRLLVEASRAVEPPAPGFWERLRFSLRMAVMHPAMTAAVTLVLVLGVSFHVYRQGPAPSSSRESDPPLVEESQPLPEGRTAAIGVAGQPGSGEAVSDEAAAPAAAPQPAAGMDRGETEEQQQATARPSEGLAVRELNRQDSLDSLQGGEGDNAPGQRGGGKASSLESSQEFKSASARGRRVALDDNLGGTGAQGSTTGRLPAAPNEPAAVATSAAAPTRQPQAEPALQTRESDGAKKAERIQLAKRSEKASMADKELAALPSGSTAGGAVASPAPKPAPARRKTANKLDGRGSEDAQEQFYGQTESQGEARDRRPAPAPAGPAAAEAPRKVAVAPRPDQDRTPADDESTEKRPVTVSQKRVQAQAPLAQVKSGDKDQRAQTAQYLALGDSAYKAGRCTDVLLYYSQALSLDPSLRATVEPKVRGCAGRLGDETLAAARRQHPNLGDMLDQVQVARRKAREAEKGKEETKQKKASKKGAADAYQNSAY